MVSGSWAQRLPCFLSSFPCISVLLSVCSVVFPLMITLLTDFGTSDYFVGAVKGAILSINPHAQLIDITHEVPPHDVLAGAFTLNACYRDFPKGTVHLAVVDPGVGSTRRPIVAVNDGHIFVGPDNGIFGLALARSSDLRVFQATNAKFHRSSISSTFHGRDVFAPLAAHLDLGVDPKEVGPEIGDYQRLEISHPTENAATGSIIAEIIHIDHFGNCITNLTQEEIRGTRPGKGASLLIGTERVTHFGDHFAEAPEGVPFAYLGSAGYLEVALWCASAAAQLGVTTGARVILQSEGKEAR
jgi:S-adenosyl-L-methionine hydrolase (adenosine-forming)